MKNHNFSNNQFALFPQKEPLTLADFDIEGLFTTLFTPPNNKYAGWVDDAWEDYQRIIGVYKRSIELDASNADTDE